MAQESELVEVLRVPHPIEELEGVLVIAPDENKTSKARMHSSDLRIGIQEGQGEAHGNHVAHRSLIGRGRVQKVIGPNLIGVLPIRGRTRLPGSRDGNAEEEGSADRQHTFHEE